MNIRSNRFIRAAAAVLALGFVLSAPSAFAANNQQSKMTDCDNQAGDKKGDDRKAFMKSCMSATPMTQQERIAACNKKATGKTGSDRKAYMKTCLRNRD
jgi:hypothetical protein